jgi:membrane dipeptidase
MRLLVDSHQDIAWNMHTFGRNYLSSAEDTRVLEQGTLAVEANGDTLLGWPDYQRGNVALIFSTLFVTPTRVKSGDWDTQVYADANQAHQLYNRQLDSYYRLVEQNPDKFCLVHTGSDLAAVLSAWSDLEGVKSNRRVGLIPLMEGAEGIRNPGEVAEWWERGIRIIGLAWKRTRFCGGTGEPGPLTKEGRALLEGMSDVGMTLDLSHMAWEAAREALNSYNGPIIASHANALKMIKGAESNRFLTDEIIDGIIERNGVIGVIPFNRFLLNEWTKSDPRQWVSLELLATHIDYICQRAGNACHVGIGTDFDGGFGLQQTPFEIGTIADLHKLAPMLANRGYNNSDIDAIFGENWINHLKENLPD